MQKYKDVSNMNGLNAVTVLIISTIFVTCCVTKIVVRTAAKKTNTCGIKRGIFGIL